MPMMIKCVLSLFVVFALYCCALTVQAATAKFVAIEARVIALFDFLRGKQLLTFFSNFKDVALCLKKQKKFSCIAALNFFRRFNSVYFVVFERYWPIEQRYP